MQIDKYFEQSDDFAYISDNGKNPYPSVQVIQKASNTVFVPEIYVDYCNKWRKNTTSKKTWIGFNKIIAYECHDLNLTQKLIAGNTRNHSVNAVVPNIDIPYALNKLKMAATPDHIQVDHLMATPHQMTEINNILG